MAFPTTPKLIARAEKRLGLRLPNAWRKLLLEQNGGEVVAPDGTVWNVRPVRDDTTRRRLKRTTSDLFTERSHDRTWRGFPEQGLGIAADDYGNELVLLPKDDGKYAPTTYEFDHETGKLNALCDVQELTRL